MPRYFFHFRVEASLFKDENGEVLADASVALQHAGRIAAELVHGGESTNAAIVVVEDGRQLFEVCCRNVATKTTVVEFPTLRLYPKDSSRRRQPLQ